MPDHTIFNERPESQDRALKVIEKLGYTIVPPDDEGEDMEKNDNNNKKSTGGFSTINNSRDLITYLSDSYERLKNSGYIYHYTTLPVAIQMLKSKMWHLGSAKNMNDRLEYENGDPLKWNNIFFSCFMAEDKESIGMWSMYAQPWENGVKIAIPSKAARDWVKSISFIEEVKKQDNEYKCTGKKISIANNQQLKLSAVAYCNVDSLTNKDVTEKLCWSTASNTIFHDAAHKSELTGYIKDMAWSYEKEIRIRAEFDNRDGFERAAIGLTDAVINSMIITASPLFDGDLQQKIENEIKRQIKIDSSLFSDRLNIKTICQDCNYKTLASLSAR